MLASVLSGGGMRALLLPLTAVTALVGARLQITHLGVERFAVLSLILSLSLLLPFADLGVGAAVVNRTAESADVAVDQVLARTLLTSVRMLACSALAVLALDALLTYARVWPTLLGVPAASGVNVACGAALGVFALGLPLTIGQRMLLGMARNGRLVLLQGLVSPLTLLVTVIAVGLHAGLLLYALAVPLASLASLAAQTATARRLSGIRLSRIAVDALRPVRRPGLPVRATAGPMLVVTVGLPLALQTDRIILAHASTAGQVAQYAVGLQLYAPLWSVIASSGMSLWPHFAKQRQAGAGSGAGPAALGGFGAVGLAAGLGVVAAMPLLSRVVADGRIAVDLPLAAAFAGLLLVQSLQLPVGMFLTAPSGLRLQAVCVAVMVPVSCAASYPLSVALGAVGPLLGSILAITACQVVPGLTASRLLTRQVRSARAAGPVAVRGAAAPPSLSQAQLR